MTRPAITVFLPCYNAHAFLPRALDSLTAQTFQNFETIIVNDGSTDPDTLAYLETVPDHVRVIHQENRGLAGARNRGFSEAGADLILPLDCDDWLAPTFLEDALAALERAPGKTFVFADLKLEGEAEGVLHKPFNLFEQLYFNQLPYCILMPRAAWQEIGGYDEKMRLGYEDWEFNIRLVLHGWTGLPLGQPLFHYHVSATGMLASTSRARHVELWRYIRDKHAAAYSVSGLLQHWSAWRRQRSARPLILYWIWELLFRLLPNRVITRIFQISGPLSHSAREQRRLKRANGLPEDREWHSLYRSLLRQSAVPAAMVPALCSRIAAYLTLIVAARIMIPEEFGTFAVLTVLGGVINALVSGGGDMWLNRFVTRDDVVRSQPPAVWPLYLTISLCVSTVAMIGTALVVVLVPALAPQAGAILMTVLTFSLAGMSESLLAMMRATGRTILFFGVRDIFVPLTVLVLLLIWRPEEAIGFFAILAAVWATILIALFAYALLAERWKAGKGWARNSLISPVVKHTALLMLTNLGSRAANYIDVMVLLFFVGLADLGEYRIAAQFAIGFIVVQHFVFLSLPYQLRNVGKPDERELSRQRLRDSQKMLIVIAAAALLFVLVFAEWLLSFLGARFVESAYVVQAMFLIRFLELLWGPQHEILISNGLVRFEVAASMAGIIAWLLAFAVGLTQVDPITAGVIATGVGVHMGHVVRAATLIRRKIYCPRLVPLGREA